MILAEYLEGWDDAARGLSPADGLKKNPDQTVLIAGGCVVTKRESSRYWHGFRDYHHARQEAEKAEKRRLDKEEALEKYLNSPVTAQGVNSIGTCSICGYYGPGPRHECKGVKQ